MKTKMRIVALVLVLAVALTGAGYAAWGSTITATTALRTGSWEIVFERDVLRHSLIAGDEVNFYAKDKVTPSATELPLIDNGMPNNPPPDPNASVTPKYDEKDITTISGAKDVNSSNYVYTIEPTFSGTAVGFDFYNLHPGTKAVTNYEVRNAGSIPAKISDVVVRIYNDTTLINPADMNNEDDFEKLYGAMMVSGFMYKHKGAAGATTDPNEAGITPEEFRVPLSGLEAELERILVDDNFYLRPIEKLNVLDSDELEVHNFKFEIPINSLTDDDGENSKLRVEVDYSFVQYNVMVDENPTN